MLEPEGKTETAISTYPKLVALAADSSDTDGEDEKAARDGGGAAGASDGRQAGAQTGTDGSPAGDRTGDGQEAGKDDQSAEGAGADGDSAERRTQKPRLA
ncbi:hypothetical protein GPECTOR_4g822 [Gonium pectorale]|uniref:Uncharacterized protein n=1 Tax=Gonium pectorale TaxID=33097 RepID=A0A150GYG6_GONPE|nr:hypothetical protein GPECTOR_4g822 [Gonium pectorale]|eukprot:KXZ54752.1 hypothetical protein GPECTOR_4g822 [Gonium pectorale]